MQQPAQIAADGIALMSNWNEILIGRLVFAASLVHGRLDEPEDVLGAAIHLTSNELTDKNTTAAQFCDHVQYN